MSIGRSAQNEPLINNARQQKLTTAFNIKILYANKKSSVQERKVLMLASISRNITLTLPAFEIPEHMLHGSKITDTNYVYRLSDL